MHGTRLRASSCRRTRSTAVAACLLLLAGIQAAQASPTPASVRAVTAAGLRAPAPPVSRELAELAANTALARQAALSHLRPGTGACEGALQSRFAPADSPGP